MMLIDGRGRDAKLRVLRISRTTSTRVNLCLPHIHTSPSNATPDARTYDAVYTIRKVRALLMQA